MLDEPASNLDLRNQLEALEIVRRVARDKNLLVIFSIHDLNLAGGFAERLLMIENGALMADGMPIDVMTPANIGRIYGVAERCAVKMDSRMYFPRVLSDKELESSPKWVSDCPPSKMSRLQHGAVRSFKRVILLPIQDAARISSVIAVCFGPSHRQRQIYDDPTETF